MASLLSLMVVLGIDAAQVSASVPGVNEREDVTSSGTLGNGTSGNISAISRDGRYVAFASGSTNLVPNDTNGQWDVFVRDRTLNTITRVNVATDGTQSNGGIQGGIGMSDDGRYILFDSDATNLVPNDTNGGYDVFIHDMQTGTTTLVSSNSSGVEGNKDSQDPEISGDGKFVTFDSYATNLVSSPISHANIFVKNLQTGNVQLISQNAGSSGNADSWQPSISCDGGVVAFMSSATNLTSDSTNGQYDIFVDTRAGGDSLTNITPGVNSGAGSAEVSCNGLHVAFASLSTNVISGGTNGHEHIYSYDRIEGTTSIESVDSSGNQANNDCSGLEISSDGRLIAYISKATNLVAGYSDGVQDVYMRDTETGTTSIVSVNSSGAEGNAASVLSQGNQGFSGDDKYLYFRGTGTNLITGDSNVANGVIAETGIN